MGYGAIALSLLSSYGQARADEAMGDYQKTMSKVNAEWAEIQAKDAIERGDKESAKFLKNAAGILGAQRTGFAAGGVDISFGSAKQIQQQTRELAAEDAQQIRSNAFLEALGYKHQASEYLRTGNLAQSTAKSNAFQTMLGGGLRAYSQFRDMNSEARNYQRYKQGGL